MHVSQVCTGTQQQQRVINRYHNFIQSAKSRLKKFLSSNVYVNAAWYVFVCYRVHDDGMWFKNINSRQIIRSHRVEFLILLSKRRFVAIRYAWKAMDYVRFELWTWWLTNANCSYSGGWYRTVCSQLDSFRKKTTASSLRADEHLLGIGNTTYTRNRSERKQILRKNAK